MKKQNNNQVNRALFLLAFGFTLIVPTVFGLFGQASEMGLALLGGLLCMAFTNLDKFSEFKGAGFYAKMKETIDEAYATIESVRDIAVSTTSVALHVAGAFGRWGGGTEILERMKMRDELTTALEKLGAAPEAIKSAQANFDDWILRDHIHEVFDSAEYPKDNPQIQDLLRYTPRYVPTSDDVEKVFKELNIESEEVSEAMKDLKYYEKHHRLRRPEKWGK